MNLRPEIRKLIGPRAERIAWIFCCVDRATVDATIFHSDEKGACVSPSLPIVFTARPELGRFQMQLTGEVKLCT